MSTCSGGTLHRTWVCYESPLPGIDYVRSFYDSPPGSVLQVALWLLFSVRGRQFDLAVLNIVWWCVYILDSPMHDWFEKAVWQKARDPSTAFVNAPGSRMTSHDWFFFFFFFFTVFFLGTCCTKSKHWSTTSHYSMRGFCFLVCIWKKEWPWPLRQTPAFNYWSNLHTVREPLCEVKKVMADCARWQPGCSVESIIYIPFSTFRFLYAARPSICSDIDPPHQRLSGARQNAG